MNRENISKQDVINRLTRNYPTKKWLNMQIDVIENNTGMNKLRDTVVSLFLSINE